MIIYCIFALLCFLNAKPSEENCFEIINGTANVRIVYKPAVRTKYGFLRGSTMVSRNGRTFYGFQGIPYAKPPIGKLRFANPEKPEPWTGIKSAIDNGEVCLQKNYMLPGAPVLGQEDCLFLNVYTHKIASCHKPVCRKNPVMVFLHGGVWFSGSGTSTMQGPNFLMDEDIVLVLINYRLGVFGYLSTGDDAAPGNWGQKDQLFAFQWIQDNIEVFGGDPRSVTLFGHSAGGVNIHYHMCSPLASGLFHRGILQSGSAFSLWAKPNDPLETAKKQAQFVNCPTNDTNEIVECLRHIDGMDLVESSKFFKYFSIDPLTLFTPVVEKRTQKNPNPYIDAKPLDIYLEDRVVNPVPIMLGTVSNEGAIRTAPLIVNQTETNELNQRFDEFVPRIIELKKSVKSYDVEDIYEKIIEFYMDGVHELNNETFPGFTNIYTDHGFIHPVAQAALLHTKVTPNVYFYHFDYRGKYSFSSYYTNSSINFGIDHTDDLIYLFCTPTVFPVLPPNDLLASQKMVKLWTNFAKYGNPTPKCSTWKEKWLPLSIKTNNSNFVNSADLFYFYMYKTEEGSIEFAMRDSFLPDRMQFLDSLPLEENRRLYGSDRYFQKIGLD